MRMLFGLSLAVVGTLGCSDDGAVPRGAAGTAGQVGVSGAGGSAGSGGSAAGTGGAAGSGGGTALDLNLGDALELVAGTGDVPYAIGDNAYGIRGGAFLARSDLGNTISVGDTPGEICISGNLEEVPMGNYGQYWGVEIGFNLNQVAPDAADAGDGVADAAAPPSDAGLDAAAPSSDAAAPAPAADVAEPWRPGNVIGFSYVIEGPTINLVRFKALPDGYDPALESSVFCKTVEAQSGVAESSLFSEMTQYCWSPNNPQLPTGAGLDNISWQLPADVAPAGQRPFDWCLKELRPILAEP